MKHLFLTVIMLALAFGVVESRKKPKKVCSYDSPCGANCWNLCEKGFPCTSDDDCISGLCVDDANGKDAFCEDSSKEQEPNSENPAEESKQDVEKDQSPSEKSKPTSGKGGQSGSSWSQTDFSAGLGPWNVDLDAYGKENRAFVQDPAGGSDVVLKVTFPAGSRNPKGPIVGGTGFYANPIDLSNANEVEFSFKLYAPNGFNWVKGGKLPGLYAGQRSCSGGKAALDCFSTRFMWRTEGLGEIYLYVPKKAQNDDYCRVPPLTHCNPGYGDSLGRGAFTFKTGEWNSIRQVIKLNTFSGSNANQDGTVDVYVGGSNSPAITFNTLVWRTLPNVKFIGIDFETFFGGSDKTWVTPTTQELYFKDFSLSVLGSD